MQIAGVRTAAFLPRPTAACSRRLWSRERTFPGLFLLANTVCILSWKGRGRSAVISIEIQGALTSNSAATHF